MSVRGWKHDALTEDADALEDEAAWPGKRSAISRLQSKKRSPSNKSAAERVGSATFHAERVEKERSPAAIVEQLGEGEALAAEVGSSAAATYGANLSRVRIHTNATAAQLASAHGARAFALGEHLVFAPGQFRPGTPEGDALIAHELAHVVQQQGLGPAAVQRKKLEDDQGVDSAETEADDAAQSVLARLYGGAKNAAKKISEIPSKMALRRCATGPALPADPLVRSLYAKLSATPADVQGFYGDLAALAGARAGDAQLLAGFQYAVSHGKLTLPQSYRAVAYLAYGPVSAWPLPVKNYAEGLDSGTFTIASVPPGTADGLREFTVRSASQAADGTGGADINVAYRNEFNARWDSSGFSALSSELDTTLDSKGPRSQRARAIFNAIYNDPANTRFKTAYDSHAAAFREMCDTFLGPDGTNLTASPRLAELRATLTGATVVGAGTADPGYVALVGVVTPKAAALDSRDRQEVDRQHSWRLATDAKVNGPTPAAAQTLRDDLWRVVTTSRGAAPAAPPVAPVGPVATVPPPVPNAAQTAFLHGITITAMPAIQNADTATHPLAFTIHGPANPGLAVNRHVRVEPAAQVVDGENEQAWANGATDASATINVDPQPTAGPSTVFTAHLTMPPLSAATFPDKTATVTVVDHRLDWFKTNLNPGLTFANFTDQTFVPSGGTAHYTGGQCPIQIHPGLGGQPNPGLDIQIDGTLSKNGVVAFPLPRAPFDRSASELSLFQTILRENTPPSAVPENWDVTLRVFQGTGAVAIHTIHWPFKISQTPAVAAGADLAWMASDNAWLNMPIATPGFLLNHMDLKGGNYQRVARSVAGGGLHIAATFVRSDSAAQVAALGGNAAANVAYAMGVVDPIGVATNTLVAQPGAAGWRWGAHPGTVFLNSTPIPGGARRTLDEMAEFLAHEGTHAADRDSGLDPNWDRYATEFRAYWVMGVGAGKSTAFDPTLSGIGPKSLRAQDVFHQVYGSSTYPFVKPAYDGNVNRFRERADNYLFPDGINMVLSPQLIDLRATVEGYVSGAGTYPATKPIVLAKYAACPAGDRAEIANNRMWRDLVEQKFPLPTEQAEIKTALGIPQ